MPFVTIAAHYDGEQVRLDEKVELPANARLIVTVLEGTDAADVDSEREEFLRLAATGLARAYDADEVEYSEADLKSGLKGVIP